MWRDGWTGDLKWSLYLKPTCTSDVENNAGTLWVEQLDREHCGAVESVVPIKYDGDAYRVHATLLSVHVPTSTYPLKGIEGRWKAAFSTTSPHIVIPETTFKPLNEIYWHATEDKDTGDWIVDCKYYDDTEELQFTFEGNPNAAFTFKLGHFIDKVGAQCVMRIRPTRSNEMFPDRWVFGLPLFRKYCALFDIGFGPSKNTVSFAEQKGYKVPNCTYDAVKTLAPCTPTTNTTTSTISTPTTPKAASCAVHANHEHDDHNDFDADHTKGGIVNLRAAGTYRCSCQFGPTVTMVQIGIKSFDQHDN
ncbi:hypothetical protein AAVH_31223 [Aphelenchoides avenae]|nr:hypothetical protein AAVH_31223 [Aphelenchus avenae]